MRGKSVGTNSLVACFGCLAFLWLLHLRLSNATDTLSAGQVLRDWQVLESQNSFFQLGFFNPYQSSNRYLAIRCMDWLDKKIVWVANRDNPLNDTSGYLNVTLEGYLVIRDEKGTSFTVNSGSPATSMNASLTLLDSGNLVLKAGQGVVWQSFDHPTDTILPGMKIGLFDLNNLGQPRKQFLTSWIGVGNPSSAGAFALGVNPNNTKQLEVRRRGIPYWRSANSTFEFSYTSNENESYFSYTCSGYDYAWIEMNSTGEIRCLYGTLNAGGYESLVSCDTEKTSISEGCIEQQASKCHTGDEFVLTYGKMNWYEGSDDSTLSLTDCEEQCRKDCSCTAYASYTADGSGCFFSHGQRDDFVSLRYYEFFYIRNSTTQRKVLRKVPNRSATTFPPSIEEEIPRKKRRWVLIFCPLAALVLLGLASSFCYLIRKYRFSKAEKTGSGKTKAGKETQQFMNELGSSIAAIDESSSYKLMLQGSKDHELPLFSFSTVESATGRFSEQNKLGQGGFGPVFKGTLVDGQEIAVKRLSERSSQGVEEFKNEVMLISKVQHRNLVRLFGCCIKGEEKLLIYEYLPNKSLDTFLLDETKRLILDWKVRMNIIEGIAQGLLYLHKYSRLKIIHRDLKTSNILLDNNMNPKISDFGTAKIFRDNESRANTSRIVGTFGYMSPEYAMDGLFSVKSDVFSFGVMLLEIISGKRNTGFYQSNQSLNLVRHAWNLWKEEKSLELMDQTLAQTCSTNEFERCIQIALLCVQENAEDRPTMSNVVSMLGSNDILPEPNQSFFPTLLRPNENNLQDRSDSINSVTISTTHGR